MTYLHSTIDNLPCRHPRTTKDRQGNGSNKSFALHSHLRNCDPQAPIFRRLTLHPMVHALSQIIQDQVRRSVLILNLRLLTHLEGHPSISDAQPSLFTGSSTPANVTTSTSTTSLAFWLTIKDINSPPRSQSQPGLNVKG